MNEDKIEQYTEETQNKTYGEQNNQYQEVNDSGSKGPIIGVIIILIILVVGALYMWTTRTNINLPFLEKDEIFENLEKQSNSDEIEDIETDLSETELEGLDSELSDIEAELNDL